MKNNELHIKKTNQNKSTTTTTKKKEMLIKLVWLKSVIYRNPKQ
jgi:hypothetical protein